MHCIINRMQFKNVSLCYLDMIWCFFAVLALVNYMRKLKNVIWDLLYKLLYYFLAGVVLLLAWFLSFFYHNKAQICNTNTWFSHIIVSHFANSFLVFLALPTCCVTLWLLFIMLLENDFTLQASIADIKEDLKFLA